MDNILDFSKMTGTPWLKSRTIYLTKHGSQAYGTNIATSDLDVKGVAIPPREYFLGFNKQFEQAEFHKPDAVIFDIRKFLKLAADCNPNVVEIINTDESDVLYRTPLSDLLRSNRHLFLSKKVKHTFSGYAHSQMLRIMGHYRWLKNPPQKKPTRSDFGLPEAKSLIPPSERDYIESAIKKYTDSHRLDLSSVDDCIRIQAQRAIEDYMTEIGVAATAASGIDPLWYAGAQSLGLTEQMQYTLLAEKRYSTALKDYQAYESWKANRNADRAALESKFGYDVKHGMHLVRLMRMCEEILSGQGVLVRRPDREELLAIRGGAWSYEQLIEWAEQKEKHLEELYLTSKLPNTPDKQAIDKLCVSMVELSLSSLKEIC